MRRLKILLPLIMFLALSAIFAFQLLSNKDNSIVPSALIGKRAPDFVLNTPNDSNDTTLLLSRFITELPPEYDVVALNVWASWCVPCRAEHPQITQLAKMDGVALIGLNYKDENKDAEKFLNELGNPYLHYGTDPDGRFAVNFGVYGVPETFLIDRKGIIRYKHVGPIIGSTFVDTLIPEIKKIRTD